MTTVYCATTNAGKLREFALYATEEFGIQPLPELRNVPAPEETGHTFEENAIQKALYYGAYCAGFLFAEDSGLEVEALGGAPGVHSARFAGVHATDEENNELLLRRLSGAAAREARFVCTIALVYGGSLVKTFRGEVSGTIASAAQGRQGFGYDPLFFYEPFGCTFGEVGERRKQTVSHRGKALDQLRMFLIQNAARCPTVRTLSETDPVRSSS